MGLLHDCDCKFSKAKLICDGSGTQYQSTIAAFSFVSQIYRSTRAQKIRSESLILFLHCLTESCASSEPLSEVQAFFASEGAHLFDTEFGRLVPF